MKARNENGLGEGLSWRMARQREMLCGLADQDGRAGSGTAMSEDGDVNAMMAARLTGQEQGANGVSGP
jgi:hypothetical protein